MRHPFRKLSILIFQFLFPLLIFVKAGEWVILESSWLYQYTNKKIPFTAGVQWSKVRLENEKKEIDENSVIFTGSSSVLNGIDPGLISNTWGAQGLDFKGFNFGMTGMVAYELPMSKHLYFFKKPHAIVYLYNSFSFPDSIEKQNIFVGGRWNTMEYLKIFKPELSYSTFRTVAKGILYDSIPIVAYSSLIQSFISGAITGNLKKLVCIYDVCDEPDANYKPPVDFKDLKPVADDRSDRRKILESLSENTTGYRGFERFLQLAKQNGVKVYISPVPEPAWTRHTIKHGIDLTIIERRVKKLTASGGGIYLENEDIQRFEENDSMFRDQWHLHKMGRIEYSKWLAKRIAQIERKPAS